MWSSSRIVLAATTHEVKTVNILRGGDDSAIVGYLTLDYGRSETRLLQNPAG